MQLQTAAFGRGSTTIAGRVSPIGEGYLAMQGRNIYE
jgi:hypothetical protein